jgi:elongation factor P
MKFAQEIRAGNVVVVDGAPLVIQKAEFNKSGRNSAVMKFKFRNLLTGGMSEGVHKIDEKFEDIVLDSKEVSFSYEADGMYIFMDAEYNQYEISADDMGDALNYLEEQMPCEITFYNGKPLSIKLPIKLVREITYTEPAARGDTSGKVMKAATLPTGYVIQVPAFIETGEKVEIDTRTNEYVSRAK